DSHPGRSQPPLPSLSAPLSRGRWQFPSAADAICRAAASAPPPHDGAGHDKYYWEDAGQEDHEPPDRPAVTTLVDPTHPLHGAIAGERAGQPFDGAAAIINHNGSDLTASSVAQLHAPARADGRAASLLLSRSAPRTRVRS